MTVLNNFESLDKYLSEYSYIAGFEPSDADNTLFEMLGNKSFKSYCNILRWYNHINSFGGERKHFPKCNKSLNMPYFDFSQFIVKAEVNTFIFAYILCI